MGRCLPSLLAEEEREQGRELLAVGGREGSLLLAAGRGAGKFYAVEEKARICFGVFLR